MAAACLEQRRSRARIARHPMADHPGCRGSRPGFRGVFARESTGRRRCPKGAVSDSGYCWGRPACYRRGGSLRGRVGSLLRDCACPLMGLTLDRVEMPVARDALEFVLAAILEGEVRTSNEIPYRAGDEGLARPGARRDPCSDVDGYAPELVAENLALA